MPLKKVSFLICARTIRFLYEIKDTTQEENMPMSADEMITKLCGGLPEWAVCLRGLRVREELTQAALGKLLHIDQTNISQMECGKRTIGKQLAKRLAKLFKIDYRIFL